MANGLLDIPMRSQPPEDEGSRMPPMGEPPMGEPPMGEPPMGDAPTSAYDVQAPESLLSGGTWERFAPGQFAYHPSEEDLAMPDLIEHFGQIEVVGDLLIMPDGNIYEGRIAHDVDADGQVDAATHKGPPGSTPSGEQEPDGDEELSTSKLGVPPGNSWMDKPGPSIMPPNPTKHY